MTNQHIAHCMLCNDCFTDKFVLGMQMLQCKCNVNKPISHFKLVKYFIIFTSSFN